MNIYSHVLMAAQSNFYGGSKKEKDNTFQKQSNLCFENINSCFQEDTLIF